MDLRFVFFTLCFDIINLFSVFAQKRKFFFSSFIWGPPKLKKINLQIKWFGKYVKDHDNIESMSMVEF